MESVPVTPPSEKAKGEIIAKFSEIYRYGKGDCILCDYYA